MMLDYPEYSWEPFNNIGYLLRRANLMMVSRVEIALAQHELTFVQWLIMLHLCNEKARTAAELCREINYDSGALTRIVEHLSKRGFIARNRNSGDRRLVELNVTCAGRKILDSLKPAIGKCLNASLANLTQDETKTLLRLLGKLVHGFSDSPATEPALSALSEALR